MNDYKTISLLSIILLCSCVKEELVENAPQPGVSGIAVTAIMPEITKVQYSEGADGNLYGTWETGDVVQGMLQDGAPFNFVVTSVNAENGTAVLEAHTSHEFVTGEQIFAVAAPSGTAEGFVGGELSVDFSVQQASSFHALMFAEAVVEEGPRVVLQFRNAASIIGVVNPAIEALNLNRRIEKVIVSGHNVVSSGKVRVSGGSLVFTPDLPSDFIEKNVGVEVTSGTSGTATLAAPVYVAVPPCTVAKVTLLDNKGVIYSYDLGGEKEVPASKYCRIKSKSFPLVHQPVSTDVSAGGVLWADRNLGATSVSSGTAAWGDMYRWADGELLYTSKVYNTSTGEKTITFKSEYPTGFSAVAGQNYYNGSTYDKYNSTDGKTVLDPVDDIVQLTYPGSGWRMPTMDEYRGLPAAVQSGELTLNTGTSTSYLYYQDTDGNTLTFTRPYNAKAAGFNDSERGRYWSSTVVSAETDAKRFLKGYYFRVNSSATAEGTQLRNLGYYIRPVRSTGLPSGGAGGGADEPELPNCNAGKSVASLPDWSAISIDYTNLTAANHPRLFLRNRDIKNICTKVAEGTDENMTKLHNAVLSGARTLVRNTTALKYDVTVGGQLVLVSRKALLRIADLAYAYRVTGEERYLEMADWNINTVCDFPDWHSEHFLDVAEMAAAVAIGYDWLYNDLPDATREKARERLKTFALEEAGPNNIWAKEGNWNQVCMGGLICAALAIYEDYPELSDEVIRKALASNAKQVKAIYSPSGACPEGPGYWEYGTTYQGILNMACETALGTDFEIPSIEGFSKTGLYYMYARGNSGKRFNYSDSGEKNEASLGLWYFASKFNKGYYLYQDIGRLDDGSFATEPYAFLALTCCNKLEGITITCPTGRIYKANGSNPVMMCRTGWGSNDLYLGLKGGEANISHAHMDVGEIVFDAYGTRWFKDFTYSTDYGEMRSLLVATGLSMDELGNREWDSWRWKFFQYGNLRHSTITVNMQNHWPYGVAEITKIDETSRLGGCVDLTNTFYSMLKTGNRTAVIKDDSYLEVTDVLTALDDKDASIRWTCASDASPSIAEDGIVLTDSKGVQMKISTDAPGAVFSIWSVDPATSEDYTSPFVETEELHQNPLEGYLCGFEYVIPAGSKSTVITTLRKL